MTTTTGEKETRQPGRPEEGLPEIEYRVIGPPGCGKTTWLGQQVENAVEKGQRILITSQTRAAAAEITGRRLPIPDECLGTLHSHCYHILGKPELTLNHLEEWNSENPAFAITITKGNETQRRIEGDNPDAQIIQTPGDQLMADYSMVRSRMGEAFSRMAEASNQTGEASSLVQQFGSTWEEWKQKNALMDFQDLIEICLRETSAAPGNPDIIFVDEAQDLDYTEMKLIRKWGAQAGYLITVGDPEQCIYSWRGATPEAFITPELPPAQNMVLSQSYRVPLDIHNRAISWISKIDGRDPIPYYPRDHPGKVRETPSTWEEPKDAVSIAQEHTDEGKSVMFLTTCAYMLQNVINELRQRSIPYHNPFRRNNGAWNPLAKRGNAITTGERILAFLALSQNGLWTAQDIRRWSDALTLRKHLSPGGRKEIKSLVNTQDGGVSAYMMERLFSEELLKAGLTGDLDFFQEHLTAAKRDTAKFPLSIAMAYGPKALEEPPRTTVGTIHSVKGGEADVVVIFPDLSMAGNKEWAGTIEQRAGIIRLFYVGITRSRETLVFCRPAGRNFVEF